MKMIPFTPRLRFGLVLACLLAPLAATPSAWAQNEKPIKVPFELLKTQHIIVKVKVNGRGPYTLIFDTGAPITLISSKIAKEAEVFDKDFKKPAFTLFGAMGEVKVKTLEVGGVKAENVASMVMDHPTVGVLARALKMPIEGIVGFPFFARYRMTLDYQAKEMTFVPSGYDPPDMFMKMTTMMAGGANAKKKVLTPGALIGVKVGKEPGDDKNGVTIREVFAGGPAAAAGLKAGDRLLVLDGRWTDSVADTYEAAAALRAGTTVPVVIKRKGKEETHMLKLRAGL